MKYWQKLARSTPILLGLALTLLATQSVCAEVVDRVVAKVNGEIITLSTVEERVAVAKQQLKAAGNPSKLTEKEIVKKTLNSIIEEKLQLQEANKSGLEVDDESVENAFKDIRKRNNITEEQMKEMLEAEGRTMEQYKEVIRDQILVTKVVQFRMGKSANSTPKQIKRYYYDHQKEYWQPRQPFVRHILFIVDENASPEKRQLKKIKINEILRQIRAGNDFSEMAIKYSEDVTASSGGEIGLLKKGILVPEFEEVAFSLKPGEISDVVESRYGYHIIKVDRVIPGKAKPLDEVKEQIEQVLQFKNRQERYQKWMDEAKSGAMIQTTLFQDENSIDSPDSPDSPKQDLFLETAKSSKVSPKGKYRNKKQSQWEEASNVKRNHRGKNLSPNQNNFKEIKNRLAFIKRLRRHEKISEDEYQVRKRKLLDQL
jgi:peptidyl-prolyl cis-trans isomerase SurA